MCMLHSVMPMEKKKKQRNKVPSQRFNSVALGHMNFLLFSLYPISLVNFTIIWADLGVWDLS